MKLYYAPKTRAGRPRWLLEEIGAPYELVRLDLAKKEHKQPEYLAVHPHGVVPALVDGDLTLLESSAICMYLADKFPDAKMAPPVGTPARGRYYQWMVYAMATFEPSLIQIGQHTSRLPEAERSATLAQEARANLASSCELLARSLGDQPFLLGAEFSAADVMIGSLLVWASFMNVLGDQPALTDYFKRLGARPAAKRARAD